MKRETEKIKLQLLMHLTPNRSINFFTYGNGKKLYTELNHGKETPAVHLMSAATAGKIIYISSDEGTNWLTENIIGIVTSTATNPIWVIKTRLQLQGSGPRRYKNSLDCALHIIKEEGVRGLYKGMSASYLGKSIVIGWPLSPIISLILVKLLGVAEGTIQWVIYEDLKKKWASPKQGLLQQQNGTTTLGGKDLQGWLGNIGAAAVAKLVAACITYPHEVIRTRLRQPAENGVLKYTGLWQCLRLVAKEEGIAALYGGMTAHLMRVVPNAAIMFFCYEAILHRFGNDLRSH